MDLTEAARTVYAQATAGSDTYPEPAGELVDLGEEYGYLTVLHGGRPARVTIALSGPAGYPVVTLATARHEEAEALGLPRYRIPTRTLSR